VEDMGKEVSIIVLYAIIGFFLALGGLIVSSQFNMGYYGESPILQILGVFVGFFSFFVGSHLFIVALISLLKRKK